MYDPAKACIYDNGAYLQKKKKLGVFSCLRFLKKICPKTFGPHCIDLPGMPFALSEDTSDSVTLTMFYMASICDSSFN
jgi:hypothetical protein